MSNFSYENIIDLVSWKLFKNMMFSRKENAMIVKFGLVSRFFDD